MFDLSDWRICARRRICGNPAYQGSYTMKTTQNAVAPSWLEVDMIGLRRTLERKGKAWAIFELVQNSWDTDATQVDVTLTKPKNLDGQFISTLICKDNAPDGYRDLSEAH